MFLVASPAPNDDDVLSVDGVELVELEVTVYSPDDIHEAQNSGLMNEEEADSRWSQFS